MTNRSIKHYVICFCLLSASVGCAPTGTVGSGSGTGGASGTTQSKAGGCQNCTDDSNCGSGICVPLGHPGDRCLDPCSVTCSAAAHCERLTDTAGAPQLVCVPNSGSCTDPGAGACPSGCPGGYCDAVHGVCVGGSGGSTSGGTSGGSGGSGGGSSSSSGSTTSGGTASGGAITCSAPANYQQDYSGSCGSERWSVKTGTDDDVMNVNLSPEPTTIANLTSMSVPSNQGASCNRNPPAELQTYELQNVKLSFHALESDGDYHLIASDGAGNTMIVEVPDPACVGVNACTKNTPFLCDITHARAAVQAARAGGSNSLGTGTVLGVGFFDSIHGQTGVAPNGIELHPVLAICFGQNCNPLQGY